MFRRLLRFFNLSLILGGLGILFFIFGPVAYEEVDYQVKQTYRYNPFLLEDPEEAELVTINPQLFFRKKYIIPANFDFSLVVPKIGVSAAVFPHIDSGNPEEYLPVLKKGVAHAQGSRLPDQPGVVFIFAHSTDSFYNITRYNATFFLLNKLTPGDQALIFYQTKKYTYQVVERKIVKPEEVNQEVKSLPGNFLVLQTCYPPGTTLKRLIVIAKAI